MDVSIFCFLDGTQRTDRDLLSLCLASLREEP